MKILLKLLIILQEMITNEKYKGKFIKINKLYDEQEERQKLKMEDKNYNALSDESNIRFF
jgi:hypothetical protein